MHRKIILFNKIQKNGSNKIVTKCDMESAGLSKNHPTNLCHDALAVIVNFIVSRLLLASIALSCWLPSAFSACFSGCSLWLAGCCGSMGCSCSGCCSFRFFNFDNDWLDADIWRFVLNGWITWLLSWLMND